MSSGSGDSFLSISPLSSVDAYANYFRSLFAGRRVLLGATFLDLAAAPRGDGTLGLFGTPAQTPELVEELERLVSSGGEEAGACLSRPRLYLLYRPRAIARTATTHKMMLCSVFDREGNGNIWGHKAGFKQVDFF